MPYRSYKSELNTFMSDIVRIRSNCHVDKDDFVWDKIIDDAVEANRQSNVPFMRHQYKSPFISSERPDILYECDNFLMGIECFSFDASLKTKRGSTQIRKETQAHEAIRKEDRQKGRLSPRDTFYERTIDVVFSIENYVKSLLATFQQHAKNIDIYRRNIAEFNPKKQIYLSFYIQDVTALGNYVLSNGVEEPICPLFVKEFIDELSNAIGLDYVVVKFQKYPYMNSIHIQKIHQDFLESLYTENYDFSKDIYLPYNYTLTSHFYSLAENEDEN